MAAEIDGTMASGTAGIDVLLVEDEAILMLAAGEALRESGYKVQEHMSAEEALAALDGGCRPAMLITDHGLPGLSGIALAELARDRFALGSILIVTGNPGQCPPHFDVLNKPYRDDELLERVRGAIGPAAG